MLFHVVLELLPDRGIDCHRDREGENDEDKHHDEGDESDVDKRADGAEDAEHDTEHNAHDQHDEEHDPFAAVGGVVRGLDGLYGVLALLDEEIVGERPGEREHDAGNVEEEGGDQDGEDHQPHGNEELAHVAAVLAVEDADRVDYLAFGQLCRQECDGDEGSDVQIGDPDRDEKQYEGCDDRGSVFDADVNSVAQCGGEIEFFGLHGELF